MESMPAKILASCNAPPPRRIHRVIRLLAEPLKEATQRARESERAVFQNLECLTSPESAQETLKLRAETLGASCS
jgi:hypothetical protein